MVAHCATGFCIILHLIKVRISYFSVLFKDMEKADALKKTSHVK